MGMTSFVLNTSLLICGKLTWLQKASVSVSHCTSVLEKIINIHVIWDMTVCSLLGSCLHVGGTCCPSYKVEGLLLPLSTISSFFKFVYCEIPGESAWRVLFRPPWCYLLLWQLKVIRTELTSVQNWTHFSSGLLISRTFLPHVLYFFACI